MREVDSIVSQLESRSGIEDVLAVIEVGSRSYGLHTDESDHDCYVLFKQNPNDYAKLNTYNQNIPQEEIVDGWEIQGWNIKRFGELAEKNNPTVLEFVNSPLRHYLINQRFEPLLCSFTKDFNSEFSPIGLYYHYNSLIQKNYQKYIAVDWKIEKDNIADSEYTEYLSKNTDEIEICEEKSGKILRLDENLRIPIKDAKEQGFVRRTTTDRSNKRILFILRAVCCAKWVRENRSVPPLDFTQLLEEQKFLNSDIETKIQKVVDTKISGETKQADSLYRDFIDSELKFEIDRESYDQSGIEEDRVNNFIGNCLGI